MDSHVNDPGSSSEEKMALRPLSIWFPVLLLAGMITARFLPSLLQDPPAYAWMFAAFGPMLLSLVGMVWWLGFSRASGWERWAGAGLVLIAMVLVGTLLHPTMLGPTLIVMTIPSGIAAFMVVLVLLGGWRSTRRTWSAVVVMLLVLSGSLLLRTVGVWGDFSLDLRWRWEPNAEDVVLGTREPADASVYSADQIRQAFMAPDWPGFRGPRRDGVWSGTQLALDSKVKDLEEVWRIKVGPAWSSFAAASGFLVTQEQRGERETVVCYAMQTGSEVWRSDWDARFEEGLGGLGPRATPTIDAGFVYAQGAAGDLVKLDAGTGDLVWKVDLKQVAQRQPPMWGFSCSPLVVDGLVVVHSAGGGELGILAFDAENGELRWSIPASEQSYGSLQVIQLFDRKCLAFLTDAGLMLIEPAEGATVLNYEWPHGGYRAVQPLFLPPNKMLIGSGLGTGTRLIELTESDGRVAVVEQWTSKRMRPDFNDFVTHEGYLYGFDDSIFSCLDLATGDVQWRGGRYGKGQVLLLADSGHLVVMAETGELVIVDADPEDLMERINIPAVSGKTWNHPVVVGNMLFVRNASEAVAYRLPVVMAVENER